MEIDSKILSSNDKSMIEKDLTVYVKSDYALPRKYKIYKHDVNGYGLPFVWAIDKLSYFPPPMFVTTKIKIKSPKITLRPLQVKCIAECSKEFDKPYGGGIINLQTGGGKTVCSLYLIGKYKMKTLIIVNTVELMNQWVDSIKKFLPDAKLGKIQGGTFDVKGKDIVIGMVQTISMRKEYTKEKFSEFSIVFTDEIHHFSAEVFSEALFKTRARYTFGLSATVERKDKLEYIFKWHIGEVIFSDADGIKKQKTEFIKLDYKGESSVEEVMRNGKPKISTMITCISEDTERTKMICDYLKLLPDSRRILVLGDRVAHLNVMHNILGDKISGMFTGKTPETVKESSKKKKIMLATYQIASEGFNHPALNTLLFATPRSSVTQAIGRIYRKHHDISPMIIDVVDWFSVFPYQYKKRKAIYNKQIDCKKPEENECLFD